MGKIPTKLTEAQFQQYVEPFLSKARRGFVSRIPLFKIFNYILYLLHTGCQWAELPIEKKREQPDELEITYQGVYHHFRKWSRDGSLEKVWQGSIDTIAPDVDTTELNLDGSHCLAKKGGEAVAYQGRKKGKTSNILPLFDKQGYVLASTKLVAGNHNDAFELKPNLQQVLKDLKFHGLTIVGAYLNADSAFDTQEARKVCFNHGVRPNIPENKRNRKRAKPGPNRLFDRTVYTHRFCAERSFAWIDKFKRLLIRFEIKEKYFFGLHCLAFAMINLRNVVQ